MIKEIELNELANKYETEDFIKDDPIQFPHRFLGSYSSTQSQTNSCDIELAAFIASIFAYGNRKVFIKKLNELFDIMQNKPLEFVLNFNPESLKGFNYRFAKDFDVIEVLNILNRLYKSGDSLKSLFEYGYSMPSPFGGEGEFRCEERVSEIRERGNIQQMFQVVTDYFYSNVKNEVGQGFYHLIPNPKNGGAMKRMCMFLRWMVRKGPVDLGVWDFIPQSNLLIPLDVHVARLSREMGLLSRSSNDFKAVLELTANLKKIDSSDPAKFDFAIFGLGVDS